MAAHSYEHALRVAQSLSSDDLQRLIRELAVRVANSVSSEIRHSIMELRGLGAEIWEGIDAQEYVRGQRAT
jgi:hypothetical protein